MLNEIEVEHRLTEHTDKIKSLEHRMTNCEENNEQIHKMTTSIEKMAVNMEYMAKEQKRQGDEQARQGDRLEILEHEPADTLKYLKRQVISCIITGVVSAILGAVLALVLKGV